MKIITINLPEKYLDAIQTLIDAKTYPSRSEAIRMALRNFLLNEQAFYKTLGSMKPMFLVESKKAPRMETIKPNIGKTEVNKTVREYFRGDRDLKVLQEKPVPVQNKQIHNCSINEEV